MHGLRGREDQNSLPKAASRRLTVKGRFGSGPVLDQKYELTLLAESNAHGAKIVCAPGTPAGMRIAKFRICERNRGLAYSLTNNFFLKDRCALPDQISL